MTPLSELDWIRRKLTMLEKDKQELQQRLIDRTNQSLYTAQRDARSLQELRRALAEAVRTVNGMMPDSRGRVDDIDVEEVESLVDNWEKLLEGGGV